MRKPIIILLAVVALAALSYWLWQQNRQSDTLNDYAVQSAFTVEDTAAVSRIILRDKSPREVELIKSASGWTVKGRPVRSDAIEVLLETIRRMEMRNFVSANSVDQVLRRMSTYGKEVEIYAGSQKVKHFFVGTDTPDHLATYMLIQGAELPFAVHIPGFNGYLSSRFITDEVLWYDRQLIPHRSSELSSVRMMFSDPSQPTTLLKRTEGGQWKEWKEEEGDQKVLQRSERVIQAYIQQLGKARYEGAIVESDPIFDRKDSLLAHEPYWSIAWTLTSGEEHWLKAYRIRAAEDAADSQGRPLIYDPDRMHAVYDDGRMVLLQFYGLRTVLSGTDAMAQIVE